MAKRMRKGVSIFVWVVAMMFAACSDEGHRPSTAERKAMEDAARNLVKKGRYHCYWLFKSGDKNAEDLFVLSDKLYQMNETVGAYAFDKTRNAMKMIDGPLRWPADTLLGFYTPKGSATAAGGHTLESMIEFRAQKAVDSGNRSTVLLCNCMEKE